MLATQKELKFDSEFLTKNKPLITYRLMEKGKSKGEKSTSADPDVIASAPTPPADVTTRPAIAALTQEVQDLKAQLAKHSDTLSFVEKVPLDLWSKFKILFPAAFAPHQTAVETLVPGNVATFTTTAHPANSQPKEQGQKLAETPPSKRHKTIRECLWCFCFCFLVFISINFLASMFLNGSNLRTKIIWCLYGYFHFYV